MSTIAITGSTGLMGEALVTSLTADGHEVRRITRRPSKAGADDIVWDVGQRRLDPDRLEGIDAVVHLAGEPIGAARWTSQQKRRLVDSRREGTRLLAETLAELSDPPAVLLSASAVGYYGDRGEDLLTEAAGPGDDFMARLCRAWEEAAAPAAAAGIRVVHPRTGVVMAPEGPLIEKVEVPFKLGVGGRVGSGRQWVPWVSLQDQVAALRFMIDHDELEGPVNVTAPAPVRNRELTDALGAVLRRPTLIPVPMVALRLLYGEMGVTLASVSQRVVPERLLEAGFEWTYPDLREALAVALDRAA